MKYHGSLIAFLYALLICGWSVEPVSRSQSEQSAYDDLRDPRLVSLLKAIAAKSDRMETYPQDARYLYDLILKNRLISGLEIGTAGGYGTIWLGMAFGQTGGRLVAVETSKEQGRVALSRLEQAGQLDRVSLLLENPLKVIPMLTGPYDFVFLDGRKQDYTKYLELLLPIVRPGGFIVAHDVTGQSRDLAEFLRRVMGDPALKTELVPISTAGLSVTQKKAGIK
jgi:predicted O-methyltransferase YrrM